MRSGAILLVVIVIGVAIAVFREDEIDRFINDRNDPEVVAEFNASALPDCRRESRESLRLVGATVMPESAIDDYCECAVDYSRQRLNEADLRAADDGEVTDHMRLVADEAIDSCIVHIERAIRN